MNNDNQNYGGSRPEDADQQNYGGETPANDSYSGAPNMSSEESLRDTGKEEWNSPETDYSDNKEGEESGNERNDGDSDNKNSGDYEDDEIDSGRDDDETSRTPGQLGNL